MSRFTSRTTSAGSGTSTANTAGRRTSSRLRISRSAPIAAASSGLLTSYTAAITGAIISAARMRPLLPRMAASTSWRV
ncbi:hypothetical protein [Pengzhenrongella sp.]|uniref:hypothetical protein n=1 Tax=Pengzhenrongella sp. TaxID=2888820 RepID=UPI002F92C469